MHEMAMNTVINANGVLILPIAMLCGFVFGYATNQGSTCAVAAARTLVDRGQAQMLLGFAVAVGAAALVFLPLAAFAVVPVQLYTGTAPGLALVAGAALLGIGAHINGACLFGSLARFGDGELRFAVLPVGLAIGFLLASRLLPTDLPRSPPLAADPVLRQWLLAVYVVILAGGFVALRGYHRGEGAKARRWPLRRAMVLLGISGALLYALAPGWSYADAVKREVTPAAVMMMAGIGVPVLAATIAGAVAAGFAARSFRVRWPRPRLLLRSLGGGTLMAFGATLVPGGNDSLLLAALPVGSTGGALAFTVMTILVIGLHIATRAWHKRFSTSR
jgi:uncharacterized protein